MAAGEESTALIDGDVMLPGLGFTTVRGTVVAPEAGVKLAVPVS